MRMQRRRERNGKWINIQVARSHRLGPLGVSRRGIPNEAEWASKTQDFWAPHVIRDRGGTSCIFRQAKHVGRAARTVSRRRNGNLAGGPIRRHRPSAPVRQGFVNIDPMAFEDPATGKRLLYWGSGFEPIKVQELGPDRLSFAPGSVRWNWCGRKGRQGRVSRARRGQLDRQHAPDIITSSTRATIVADRGQLRGHGRAVKKRHRAISDA